MTESITMENGFVAHGGEVSTSGPPARSLIPSAFDFNRPARI